MFWKIKNLVRRDSGQYYGVFYLPIPIQSFIGKKQVWKSLGTSIKRDAIQRLASLQDDVYTFFQNFETYIKEGKVDQVKAKEIFEKFFASLLKKQQKFMKSHLDKIFQIEAEERQYKDVFYETLDPIQDAYILNKKEVEFDRAIDKEKNALNRVYINQTKMIPLTERSVVQRKIREGLSSKRVLFEKRLVSILGEEGIMNIQTASDEFRELSHLYSEYLYKWLDINETPQSVVGLNEKLLSALMGSPRLMSFDSGKFKSISFYKLSDVWFDSPKKKRLKDDRKLEYRNKTKVLSELIGKQKNLVDLTVVDINAMIELLINLPANKTKIFKGASLRQAIKLSQADTSIKKITYTTFKSYYDIFRQIMEWGYKQDFLPRNLIEKVELPDPEKDYKKKVTSFTLDDLNQIFKSASLMRDREKKYLWLPIIALYSGMRLNEIAQLKVSDIKTEEGIVFFDINPFDDDKSVKRESSIRRVPIHNEVVRSGFLKYVEHMRQSKEDRLFPQIKKDSTGKYSGAPSKWFRRVLKDCGVKRPEVKFHSFRHTFSDAGRENRLKLEIVDALGGWKEGSTSQRLDYGDGYSLRILNEEIQKIEYKGLDLSLFRERIEDGIYTSKDALIQST